MHTAIILPKKSKGGAPKGNKNALGNSGRPKELDPIEEAKALLEWLKKPTSTILLEFNTSRGYCRDRFHIWEKECVEFRDAYKLAKQTIAFRREQFLHSGNFNQAAWARYQSMYDKDLHEHERAEKAYEIELKTKAEQATLPPQDAIVARDNENMALKAQLAKLQEQIDNLTKAGQKLPGSDPSL